MKLVKITCEIRYLERIKLFGGYEAIHKDMLKKELEKAGTWLTPGLRIEDKENKRAMLVDPLHSVIDIEQPPNVGFCRDSVLRFFKSVDERLGVPQVARYGLRSTWIQESSGSFRDLVDKYKQRILGSSTLVEKADDVGVVFDYYIDGGQKLTMTVGPMEFEQLKSQFLSFETKPFPLPFLYIDIDLGDTTTKQFSVQKLSNFFDMAVSEGERLANEAITQIGVSQ
jgi:hypothetical protein